MGFYVNPTDCTKEEFLYKHGTLSTREIPFEEYPQGHLPVVLIDNRIFTAVGIAFSENEYKAFTQANDPRPRSIYSVPIAELVKVSGDDFRDYAEIHFPEVTE